MSKKCIRCGKETSSKGQFCQRCSELYTLDGWNKWDFTVRYSPEKALAEIAANDDPYFLWKYLASREIPKERMEKWSEEYKNAYVTLRNVTLAEIKRLTDDYVAQMDKRDIQKNFRVSRRTLWKINACLAVHNMEPSDWLEYAANKDFEDYKDEIQKLETQDY